MTFGEKVRTLAKCAARVCIPKSLKGIIISLIIQYIPEYREFLPYANFITANFITAVFQNYY